MHIHEGAWMVGRVQASVDWSQEGQKRSTFLSIPVDLVVGISILQNGSRPCFRLVFTIKRELRVFVTDLIFLLLLFLLPVNSPLFMHSFVPLRPFITETCSRPSIMARLRPPRDWAQNSFPYVKKAMPGSLSPGTTPAPQIYLQKEVSGGKWQCGHKGFCNLDQDLFSWYLVDTLIFN